MVLSIQMTLLENLNAPLCARLSISLCVCVFLFAGRVIQSHSALRTRANKTKNAKEKQFSFDLLMRLESNENNRAHTRIMHFALFSFVFVTVSFRSC